MTYPEAFAELTVREGAWSLVWEWIGEGDSGDYDESDPGDTPRLRATLEHSSGVEIQDGSYCTLATTVTPHAELEQAAREILATLPKDPRDFSSREMELWTWREYSA